MLRIYLFHIVHAVTDRSVIFAALKGAEWLHYYRVHFLKGTSIGDDVADDKPADEDAPSDDTPAPENPSGGNGGNTSSGSNNVFE